MLRSGVFPAIAGWAAIAANVLGLALFAPGVGVLLSIVSVLILIAWYAAVGWRFLRLDLSPDRPPAPVAN
jgi:membrane protein implicated in regulation of membrane protease activity